MKVKNLWKISSIIKMFSFPKIDTERLFFHFCSFWNFTFDLKVISNFNIRSQAKTCVFFPSFGRNPCTCSFQLHLLLNELQCSTQNRSSFANCPCLLARSHYFSLKLRSQLYVYLDEIIYPNKDYLTFDFSLSSVQYLILECRGWENT